MLPLSLELYVLDICLGLEDDHRTLKLNAANRRPEAYRLTQCAYLRSSR
jgi:hypothetical protein